MGNRSVARVGFNVPFFEMGLSFHLCATVSDGCSVRLAIKEIQAINSPDP